MLMTTREALQKFGTPWVSHEQIRTHIGFGNPIVIADQLVGFQAITESERQSLNFAYWKSRLPRDFKRVFENKVQDKLTKRFLKGLTSTPVSTETLDECAIMIEQLMVENLPGRTVDDKASKEIPRGPGLSGQLFELLSGIPGIEIDIDVQNLEETEGHCDHPESGPLPADRDPDEMTLLALAAVMEAVCFKTPEGSSAHANSHGRSLDVTTACMFHNAMAQRKIKRVAEELTKIIFGIGTRWVDTMDKAGRFRADRRLSREEFHTESVKFAKKLSETVHSLVEAGGTP